MKIIDLDKKGNVVRFYLGEKTKEWGWTNQYFKWGVKKETPDWLKPSDDFYGDDWDDVPYEHNAGRVYAEFIKGYIDVAFPFQSFILEPKDDWRVNNTCWCKDDFKKRITPCLNIILPEYAKEYFREITYPESLGNDNSIKIYYGDDESIFSKYSEIKILNRQEKEYFDYDDVAQCGINKTCKFFDKYLDSIDVIVEQLHADENK